VGEAAEISNLAKSASAVAKSAEGVANTARRAEGKMYMAINIFQIIAESIGAFILIRRGKAEGRNGEQQYFYEHSDVQYFEGPSGELIRNPYYGSSI
jgi:hypothetical protein